MHTVLPQRESEYDCELLRSLFGNANATPLTVCVSQTLWRSLAERELVAIVGFVHEAHALLVFGETQTAPDRSETTKNSWQLFESVMLGTGRKVLCFDRNLHSSTLAQGLKQTLAEIGLNCSPARVPLVLALLAHAAAGASTRELKIARAELAGRRYIAVSTPLCSKAWDGLSAAERTVLELRVMGNTYADIARQRNTSCRTVANQVAAATHRLGVSGRLDLLRRMAVAP